MALKAIVDDMLKQRGATRRDLQTLESGLKRKLRELGVLEENIDSEFERVTWAPSPPMLARRTEGSWSVW